jgi:hypothetical protein
MTAFGNDDVDTWKPNTVRVNPCVAGEPTPLPAVKVMGNVPVTLGVPASTPVAGVKVTPLGSDPVSARVGVGEPVSVTVKVLAVPRVKVALFVEVMAGAAPEPFTVRVKLWEAGEPTPLLAVKVIGKVPLAVGVPASTPVPGVKVTPPGRDPVSARVGVGDPVAVTVKVPAVPLVKVVWLTEVMAGAVPELVTVRVKLWEAFGVTPLLAVNVIGKVPLAVGVPASTPVPGVKVTPPGRDPVSARVGVGEPAAVTVKVPAVPWVKVVWLAEVMVGALLGALTVSVKLWVAFGVTPLLAVMVIGKVPLWVGVPASVPLLLLTVLTVLRVTPVGSAPVSVKVGGAQPVPVTVKLPAVPLVKVAWLTEVMAGAESAGKVPSPGLRVPESVGSGWTWKACEKKWGCDRPGSPPPPCPM